MIPIGTFFSKAKERYQVARQPGLEKNSRGIICLDPKRNFETALEDLEGFERIWIIFLFHRNRSWKPKVLPPRGCKKRGVFATRSPHRPNPIGLSCVELLGIDGLDIKIGANDLLDGSPVLDIKPYIPSYDSYPEAGSGWFDDLEPQKHYTVVWSPLAKAQSGFILERKGPDIETLTECRLQLSPEPHPGRRIRLLNDGLFELGFKTWRIHYGKDIEKLQITIIKICSGYDKQELLLPDDRWGDKKLHRLFQENFKTT